MDEAKLLQLEQGRQHLVSDRPDVFQWKGLELVLLEEVIQVLLQHLKHQAGVVLMSEALIGTNKVELISILLTESRENGDFNLALSGIAGVVLQDLDGDDLVGPLFPAFGHLTKGAPAKELEDFVLVVEGGVEHFMLNQLVVPITVGATSPPARLFTGPPTRSVFTLAVGCELCVLCLSEVTITDAVEE